MSTSPVRDDPFVRQLIARLPEAEATGFSDEQLRLLQDALKQQGGKSHAVDLRWRVRFWRWQYYFVVFVGRDRRDLTRRERELQRLAMATLLLGFMVFSTLLGLLALYLAKSAMGINLIPGFSFGIWDWFQRQFY